MRSCCSVFGTVTVSTPFSKLAWTCSGFDRTRQAEGRLEGPAGPLHEVVVLLLVLAFELLLRSNSLGQRPPAERHCLFCRTVTAPEARLSAPCRSQVLTSTAGHRDPANRGIDRGWTAYAHALPRTSSRAGSLGGEATVNGSPSKPRDRGRRHRNGDYGLHAIGSSFQADLEDR